MKRKGIFTIFITLFALTLACNVAATPVTESLDQNPNWSGAYGSGSITYESYGSTFMGSLTVEGLISGYTYQVKLEGQPNDDAAANINLGSIGRWWDNTAYTNLDDATYQSAIANGHEVIGYILFDWFVYQSGSLTIDFYLDSSYHVAGVAQSGRPSPGDVIMPAGEYTVTFLLTENQANWMTPLLKKSIMFEVAEPVPEPATVLLLGSGLISLAGVGRRKFFNNTKA